jgi:hypothetical protein
VSGRFRVLVATDDSRDWIATALRLQRPDVEVVPASPAQLLPELERHRPGLVILSAPNEMVERRVGAWLLLYPGGEDLGVIGLGREGRRAVPGIQWADLLAVVDAAAAKALSAAPPDGSFATIDERLSFGTSSDASAPEPLPQT